MSVTVRSHIIPDDVVATLEIDNFEGTDLSGHALPEADLSGQNLRKSIWREANLKEANLSAIMAEDACFDGAEFFETQFFDSHLEHASFVRSKGPVSNFGKAHLTGCNFTDAELEDSNFTDVVADGAQFVNVKFGNSTFWRGSFRGCDFTGAATDGIEDSGLLGTDFTGATVDTAFAARLRRLSVPL